MFHNLQMYAKQGHNPKKWFEDADWWKAEALRLNKLERLGPNGSCIDFCAGWFWAAATDAIRSCGIPDARLNHNGGDIVVGAQIHQGGFRIKDWNSNKKHVWTPPKAQGGRRGFSQAFPWADPATIANHRPGD